MSPEVFPTLWLEFRFRSVRTNQKDALASDHAADLSDGNAGDPGGNATSTAGGEQQLVILAAMEGKLRANFDRRLADAGLRNCWFPDFRAAATFLANVAQVGGQSVAEIDH